MKGLRAYICLLLTCLDCSFSGLVGRHLREETSLQFLEDLRPKKKKAFEKACWQNCKAAGGGLQMFFDVLSVFIVRCIIPLP